MKQKEIKVLMVTPGEKPNKTGENACFYNLVLLQWAQKQSRTV